MRTEIVIPSLDPGDLLEWALKQKEAQPMPSELWVSDAAEIGCLISINQPPQSLPVIKKEVEVWYQLDTTQLPPNTIVVVRYLTTTGVVPQFSGVYAKK